MYNTVCFAKQGYVHETTLWYSVARTVYTNLGGYFYGCTHKDVKKVTPWSE